MMNKTTPRNAENDAKSAKAVTRYNRAYRNDLFHAAVYRKDGTRRLSVHDANKLIDDALATCGDPYYTTSKTRWTKAALAFLAPFALDLFTKE